MTPRKPRPAPPNKLSETEVDDVLAVLRSERFVDCSPAQVYFTLLDEGTYLASVSSFYRILRANDEVRERRRSGHASGQGQTRAGGRRTARVWSWDITKLKGPKRGEYYDLYVVLDIFSRYVVAWCVAPSESGELAKDLIADAVLRHSVPPDQLTIHADRGSSMTSNQVAELLSFLGIRRSHSRPHVSNDNPYSEAQFKTLKYCPASPNASAPSPTPGSSASRSSRTTTMNIVIRGSAITHRPRCTTALPQRYGPSARRLSTPPTPRTRADSATANPSHPSCPPSRGSTSR